MSSFYEKFQELYIKLPFSGTGSIDYPSLLKFRGDTPSKSIKCF